MLRSGAIAAIATVVFLLVLWILVRVGRVLTRQMTRLADATTEKLRVGGTELVQRQRALGIAHAVTRIGGWFLILLVDVRVAGLRAVASFRSRAPWGEHLNQFLFDTVTGFLVAIAGAMPDIVVALVIFVLAHWVDRAQRGFFDGVQGRAHPRRVGRPGHRAADRAASPRSPSGSSRWSWPTRTSRARTPTRSRGCRC